MIERKSGSIINIGSISGIIANRPQTIMNYCVSKAGVHQLTKNLASEWAPYNVRVNAIAPGYIETEMTTGESYKKYIEAWTSMTPIGRFGQPYEIAGMALYLASDAGGYATGSVMVVDGGYTML